MTVTEYFENFPKQVREILEQVWRDLRKVSPEALETVTYGIPTLKLYGKNMIHLGGFKDHISIFPGAEVVEHFQKELSGYETSKGTIQFPLDRPIPTALIHAIATYRLEKVTQESTKTCSRGHVYHSPGTCPICWPGGRKKK